MKKTLLILTLALAAGSCSQSGVFTKKDKKLTNKVVAWQIENFTDCISPKEGWVNAALYRGMVEWADLTDAQNAYDFLLQTGESCNWDMLQRVYDADDLCIGQTYIKLYEKYGGDEKIAKVIDRVHFIMDNPLDGSLRMENGKPYRDRWGWCDALFMAPPVYAQLAKRYEDENYLDFCLSEYRVTVDSLYDHSAHLFARDLRFIHDVEANGEKVFWGRGNGWVYAGLALILQTVPESHPSYEYYLDLYRAMTPPIMACQDAQGSWHASMLDPDSYPAPENSASGFFTYGLAWGVNNGILTDPACRDAAVKGWEALKSYVGKNGKLGYVQPIGHAPKDVTADMTAAYGVGAFLLAASEMYRMGNSEK